MATARPTVLLVDAPVALLIGFASWFSAQASRWFADGARGPWTRGGPPGRSPVWDGPVEIWWLPLPFVVLLVAGLVVRRLYPRAGFALVVLGVGGYLAVGGPYGPVLIAPAVAMWSLAATIPVERWPIPAAILLVMLTAAWWSEPTFGLLDPQAYAAVFFGLAAILVPALIGLLLRNRREGERAVRAEELRRIAYEERLRVAREVHDVVGHSLSVINLQAGVALHVLHRRPEQVEGALTAIKTTSKAALEELRSTLDVFRDPDLRLAPTAGLARLTDLVASLRSAGRTVEVRDTRTVAIPAAVDQAAFRIVQESLTNVVRHTERAAATVLLQTTADALLIEVSDDGPAGPELPEGNGIAGMRERARAVGGSLAVRPGPAGVVVSARLPIAAA